MNSRTLYKRLLSYVRPHWKLFVTAFIVMALSASLEPVFPAMMKEVLDKGFSSAAGKHDWLMYPAIIMGVFLARAVLSFAGDYAMSRVANSVIHELRERMFARMLQLPVSYYNNTLSGDLMSRVVYDVAGIAGAASSAVTVLLKDALSTIGLMAWLFYLDWKLTLITLTVAPFIALVVYFFSKRLRNIVRGQLGSMGSLTQVLQETIEAHKVIKIFDGQVYETKRFYEAANLQRRFAMKMAVASAAQSPIVQFFAAVGIAIIMGLALKQAGHNDTATAGSLVSFITAMLMILPPLKRLSDINVTIQRGLISAESVFGLIDEIPEKDEGTFDLGRAKGEVVFDQVRFTYQGSERPALQSLSLTINPGECVALVGSSGGGKTTIANLLPHFYRISEGEIRIDNQPLQSITLKSLRANVAMVSQEVVLFNDTIAMNIAYGARRGATPEEIHAAAKAAHALEFIEQLPLGFETMIGENGVKLSGGQRQRIAIARALLKNAPILILDEATSALDAESERHVQAALDTLMQGRSTLVIAHRLSTIENADRICVLQQGRVVESGTHKKLLAQKGIYANLYQVQYAEEESLPA